ncbi:MAG: M48 family metallopeptidase [Limnohabitans sp.]|nr:M48 family metallopeptidase [Limnohabitans sp.]
MSTDFFTSQDNARKQTGRLVAFFIFGVAGTILAMWAAIAGMLATQVGPAAFADWRVFLGVVGIVGVVVLIATLVKLSQLSQGGTKIAEMLGGVRISASTRDPAERQLLNIIEEMSIASGVPVPPVYVIEDASINAFAAGPDPTNSVIGVTRGCMELLSRDEMQGVIAHEYSHIFHGDTRINARTTAVIAGIMAVGVIGYICFRYIGPALARSRGGGKNNPGPAIGAGLIVVGLVVWGIGSLGMLFGRLIQAAISRQREFLADAAAVQYTRNPNGIAGALAKIRDHSSRVASPAASELNHFFFATSLNTLFATHPPIDVRIAALKAMGANNVATQERSQTRDSATSGNRASAVPSGAMPVAGFSGGAAATAAINRAGTLDRDSIAAASAWRSSLPKELVDAVRDPLGARALCYAIARRPVGYERCDATVAERDREAYETYAQLAAPLARLSGDEQLALADLAGPVLFELGVARYRAFRETLARAMRSDNSIDLREWALVKCLERHVERRFMESPSKARARLTDCAAEVRVVLATVASLEHSGDAATAAFNRAYAGMGMQAPAMPALAERTLDGLNSAVSKLTELTYTDRQKLLVLAARAAAHDQRVGDSEHLVLRAVADALDVPLPALAMAN